MKLTVINGSVRKNGSTGKILKEMAGILEKKKDVDVLYYDLIDYNIKDCCGCRICYKTGKCYIDSDKIEELSNIIKGSDGIIIGSSTHGSYVTGKLKSFWDRGHFIVEQSLFDVYGFSVATYEIADGRKALNAIKKFFLVSGGIGAGSLLKKLNFNDDPLNDKKFLVDLEKKTEKFYSIVKRKKRRTLLEFIFTKLILIPLIWKPIFIKREDEYRAILQNWYNKGILVRSNKK